MAECPVLTEVREESPAGAGAGAEESRRESAKMMEVTQVTPVKIHQTLPPWP